MNTSPGGQYRQRTHLSHQQDEREKGEREKRGHGNSWDGGNDLMSK